MKKIFICLLAVVTLTVIGVSCSKNDNEKDKEKETTCVCDRTVEYNDVVIESSTAQETEDCKVGLTSSQTVTVKYKQTGETVQATETLRCYAK